MPAGMVLGRRVPRPGQFTDAADAHMRDLSRRLIAALDLAVPVMIRDLWHLTDDQRIARARDAWGTVTGHDTPAGVPALSGGADLMYGGRHQQAEFDALVLVLAAMAYQPGGIVFATRHWCVDHAACRRAQLLAATSGRLTW